MRQAYLIVILFFWPGTILLAQHPAFRHFTVAEGLPSNEVHDVEIDREGYLWFATDRGVSRYDGYAFRNYTKKDGLADHTTHEIFRDSLGRLWFAGYSSLLSYYSNGRIRPYGYNDRILDQINDESVLTDLYVDKKDNVYYSLRHTNSFRIDAEGRVSVTAFAGQFVSRFLEDGKIMRYATAEETAAVEKGKEIFILSSDTFFIDNQHTHRQYSYQSAPYKGLITIDNGKVYYVNRDTLAFVRDLGQYVTAILGDEENFWAGTEEGIFHYEAGTNKVASYLHGQHVTGLLQDRNGGLWVTTLYAGVFYLPNPGIMSYDSRTGLDFDYISAVMEDPEGNVIIGGKDGDINIIGENEMISYSDYPHKQGYIYGFQACSGGKVYVNSLGGCIHVLKDLSLPVPVCREAGIKEATRKVYSTAFKRMVYSHDRRSLILGGNGMIARLSLTDDTFTFLSGPLLRVTSLYSVSSNELLLGTLRGLASYNIEKDTLVFFDDQPLYSGRISQIEKMEGGLLIVGSEEHGLIIRKENDVRQISMAQGLSSGTVNCIAVDGNVIWAGTDRGLNRVEITETAPLRYHIAVFNTADGLISDHINQLFVGNCCIYVATNAGLTLFRKENRKRDLLPPLVRLTGISANNHLLSADSIYLLEYDRNRLEFSYTGICFRSGDQLSYRYRLRGLEEEWRSTGNRQVSYPSLPPGTYVFEVEAENKDGISSVFPAGFAFEIAPPFWLRWWFILLLVSLISAFIAFIIVKRAEQLKNKALERERVAREKLELELKALRAQLNPHFIFNALNAIKDFILRKDAKASDRFLTEFARCIRLIFQNSRKARVSLMEELQMIHHYLELESMRFDDCFQYSIKIEEDIEQELIEIPPMIIFSYVEDAVIYGVSSLEEGGWVEVKIEMEEDMLICRLRDNGKRRKERQRSDTKQTLGMLIAEQRLSLEHFAADRKAKVEIVEKNAKSGQYTGREVVISIPLYSISIDEL